MAGRISEPDFAPVSASAHQELVNAVWEALYHGASPDDVRSVVDEELIQADQYLADQADNDSDSSS